MHTRTSSKTCNNYRIVAYQMGARLFVAQVAAYFERRERQFIGRFNATASRPRQLIWMEDITSWGYVTRSGAVISQLPTAQACRHLLHRLNSLKADSSICARATLTQ